MIYNVALNQTSISYIYDNYEYTGSCCADINCL